jgi:hypothetical protein
MAKGGESLGNEEGSEEEEEVIPAENHMPRVRPLTLGIVLSAAIPPNQSVTAERPSLPYELVCPQIIHAFRHTSGQSRRLKCD